MPSVDSEEFNNIISAASQQMFGFIPNYLSSDLNIRNSSAQDIIYTHQLLKSYRNKILVKINIPFIWAIGSCDLTTKPINNSNEWKSVFSNTFEIIEFEGDHFFVFNSETSKNMVINFCLSYLLKN